MFIHKILIKDSPSFEKVQLQLDRGLNVISGASGAGKSVFFASLLALFGIRDCNALSIEGELQGEVDLQEYPQEEELVLQIFKKDKTRYFLNHQSSSKRRICEIFSPYVKLLSHKNSNELQSEFLLSVLDGMIASEEFKKTLQEYQSDFSLLQECQKRLQEVLQEQKNLAELKEFALFEIEKIQSIQPKVGEYEQLLEFKKRLSKKEKLQAQAKEALAVLENMHHITQFLESMDCEIQEYTAVLEEMQSVVQDQSEKLNELEANPEEILERLSVLSTLIQRYGGIEEALQRLQEQKAKLASYENISHSQAELEGQISQLQSKLQERSAWLSTQRKQVLPVFEKALQEYCESLRLSASWLEMSEVALQESGKDVLKIGLGDSQVETLSSGEYNRLRLAVLAVENAKDQGILLLDEIDANLSGEESEGVAKVLKKLSETYQVFAISHQPHLPSVASSHYLVKRVAEGKSEVQKLDEEGRIYEVARMISGANLTQEALAFAKKKISEA